MGVHSRPARQRRHRIRLAIGHRSSSGMCAPSRKFLPTSRIAHAPKPNRGMSERTPSLQLSLSNRPQSCAPRGAALSLCRVRPFRRLRYERPFTRRSFRAHLSVQVGCKSYGGRLLKSSQRGLWSVGKTSGSPACRSASSSLRPISTKTGWRIFARSCPASSLLRTEWKEKLLQPLPKGGNRRMRVPQSRRPMINPLK